MSQQANLLPISGPQIRAARAFLGASQTALAEAAGIARQTVQAAEMKVTPPVGSANAIAAALSDLGVMFIPGGVVAKGAI